MESDESVLILGRLQVETLDDVHLNIYLYVSGANMFLLIALAKKKAKLETKNKTKKPVQLGHC